MKLRRFAGCVVAVVMAVSTVFAVAVPVEATTKEIFELPVTTAQATSGSAMRWATEGSEVYAGGEQFIVPGLTMDVLRRSTGILYLESSAPIVPVNLGYGSYVTWPVDDQQVVTSIYYFSMDDSIDDWEGRTSIAVDFTMHSGFDDALANDWMTIALFSWSVGGYGHDGSSTEAMYELLTRAYFVIEDAITPGPETKMTFELPVTAAHAPAGNIMWWATEGYESDIVPGLTMDVLRSSTGVLYLESSAPIVPVDWGYGIVILWDGNDHDWDAGILYFNQGLEDWVGQTSLAIDLTSHPEFNTALAGDEMAIGLFSWSVAASGEFGSTTQTLSDLLTRAYFVIEEHAITPDFHCEIFLEFVRSLDGVPADGDIYRQHVVNIPLIAAPNRGISCLSGIQHFTSVENIIVQGNYLTELDVSGLTNLIHLNASNNAIASLDVTDATALTALSISRNNMANITGLDTLESLQTFWAEANAFDSLAFHPAAPLERIDVRGNTPTLSHTNITGTTVDSLLDYDPAEVFRPRLWARVRIASGLAY